MKIKRWMPLLGSVAVVLGASAAPQETAGGLRYFTRAALESADMDGIAEYIDATLAKCPAAFAAATDLAATRAGRARDALVLRVELARSLEANVRAYHTRKPEARDRELMAWQGAKEMDNFFAYFKAERLRDEARAKLPPPVTLDVRAFGAKGDGVTDDGPAIRRALAAAKAKAPAPVTVRIPAGTYLVQPDAAPPPERVTFPNWRDYGADGKPCKPPISRPWKDYGAGFHITCHDCANLVICGEEGTEIRFTDSTRGGFGFWGCTETALKNVVISYRDNPSTQGTIVSVEKDPVSFVFKRDPGYPDPDDPRFLDAHSNRFTAHEGTSQLFERNGTGRMGTVERLSPDTFRFRPFEHMKTNPYWLARKAGERVSVIARYSESAKAYPVYMMLCSFSGAEGVTVYDAPGQSFIFSASSAMRLYDCTVRVRPGSDDLVSSNADGCMASGMVGPYIAGCRFESMEDDGINIGSPVSALEKISEDRFTCTPLPDGDAAFQVDGVTGVIKGVLRKDAKGRMTRPFGTDTISVQSLGTGAKKDVKDWIRHNSWVGKAGEIKPDRIIHIPGTVGAIVKDTSFYNLRGMGIQVHCANMLVDNMSVTHVTGPGMNINPLFGWGMVFDVHNVIVRNCTVKDASAGFVVKPGCVQPGVVPKQKMIHGIRLSGNVCELARGRYELVAENMRDVEVENARFSLSFKQKPGAQARGMSSADADSIRMRKLPNGDEEILYSYPDPAAPAREVRVTIRREADGAVRHKLSCEMRPGWFLERTSFPEVVIPCEEAKRLMSGSNKGGVFHDSSKWPMGKWQGCASPGSCCAQFAAAWNDEAGRYFGIEDAKGYTKTFGFTRGARGVCFAQRELTWTTGSYTQDYWVVTRRVAKGAEPLRWYDFADIYKAWDRKQAWSRTPLLARTDIPAWMKDAPAFTRFSRQWLGRPDAIRKFVDWWKRDIGDKPVVAALWGWEKVGTWWGPDYFPCHPSDEVFTATMKELRGRNFHPFAWPSGYNWSKVIGDKGDGTYEWDGREKFIKPVESHLVVYEDGSLCHVPAFWLRNGALTTLCGGDPWSHDWWNNLTKELARRHCDIVQVDQVVGGKLRTCWSPAHGHPVGNGLWMWQTFRRQMEEMHAAIKSVEPNGLIGVEEPNMMYNDLVGIQDYRDLESPADEFAGVYTYLYHGYVPTFQSNPFRDEFFSLAFAAAEGQMPFYKPDFAELEPSRPALQNGGFESLVDSVRGPAGWDRLIPSRMLQGVDAGKPLWNFSGCNNMGWLGYAVTLEYGDKHGGDVSLFFDVPAKGGRDNGNPIQVTQTVDGLEPGRYMLSAWVKTLNDATPGRDALPRVRTGSLKYGTCDGEMGEIAFPSAGEWTKISAEVSVGAQLRLVIWAPPGAKFLIDDVRLERDGREVVVSGDSSYTKFMKKWIALYQGEGKDFLANGFQIKPPALTCDTFRFAARQERTVCFAAYESPSGARALVLANATGKPQRVTGEWQGRPLDITLPPHDIQLVK